ncbi:centrosomal protein of 89 kDa-like [Glandiceps talaboti]
MAGKDKKSKKKKKEKLNKTWPRIGQALFPKPMIAAVPQTQRAVPDSPKVLRRSPSPTATALLTASLRGRAIAIPTNPGDTLTGTWTRRHSDSGPSRPMVASSIGSLAGSEVYDYDDMEEAPGYSTLGSLRRQQLPEPKVGTISDRPKMVTPPGSATESEDDDEEDDDVDDDDDDETESPRSPRVYHVLDKEAEQFQQQIVPEVIYAQPDKSRRQGKERPSSVTSDLTVVSSHADDYSDLAAPPPPWERKQSRNDYSSPESSVKRSKSPYKPQPIVEEAIVRADVHKVHAGNPSSSARFSASMTEHDDAEYDRLQRARDRIKEYELTKMENTDLRDELRSVRSDNEKLLKKLNTQQDEIQYYVANQEDAAKGKVQMLEQRCQNLEVQKQAVMEVNNQLHAENATLKKLAAALKEDGAGTSSLALRQQTQDMIEEIDTLKSTVHRLNVELSRYQAKYRPPEKGDPPGMPSIGPTPTWLTNTKYLAPLFLAYDDRLKEKDDIMQAYEDELEQFKTRVEEVIEENQQLHLKIEQSGGQSLITPAEWHQLQEQAKLVLEENQLLMEQLDIQQSKQKEMHRQHLQEASRISKKLILVESEKSSLEADLSEIRHKHNNLKQKHEASLMENDQKMSIHEHYSTVADIKRALEDLKEKHAEDLETVMLKLQAVQKEKKSLGLQLTDAKAENKQLEGEIKALQRAIKKSQVKIVQMQKELEFSENKGAAANHHLNSVLKVAEKTVQERDHYYQAAHKEAKEKEKAVNKIMAGSITIGKMEEKLKMYKMKANEKYGSYAIKMQERDEDFNSKTQEYERQVRHLQLLLKDKQQALDNLTDEKKNVEYELESIWQAATADNRRMKATLAKSLRKSTKLPISGGMYHAESDEKLPISSESDN